METSCINECPFEAISWLWYVIAVIVSFFIGALWYGVLFPKTWMKAVRYECACKADVANGERCTCKRSANIVIFLIQIISTALLVFMYFILTSIDIRLSIVAIIAVSSWMMSTLKFQIADWNRYFRLVAIDISYFVIVSIVATVFSLF